MKKRHRQFAGWVKAKMIPVFSNGRATPVSHGQLLSLWPGGLVNPGAVFTSLRLEKAALSVCPIDQVSTSQMRTRLFVFHYQERTHVNTRFFSLTNPNLFLLYTGQSHS